MSGHVPVLLHEAIESLDIKPDGTYVDCTLGRAGHSSEILRRLNQGGHLYGFDLDVEAIIAAEAALKEIGPNFTLIHASFASIEDELSKRGVTKVDGILADLGVSSPQFDDPSRGFSYRYDSRLDMRMDQSAPLSAYEVVNGYSLDELLRVFRSYGEDPDGYRIAKAIVNARELHPIETTGQLVELIKMAKHAKELAKKGHPAKQTFQALRIEVNGETKALEALLEAGPKLLRRGGRMAVITFMSLDDRATKNAFKELTVIEGSRHGPMSWPDETQKPSFHLLSRKPILPSQQELEENPRSASAKLRVLIKD